MATDTALCDNLAQKNVILPQIHTLHSTSCPSEPDKMLVTIQSRKLFAYIVAYVSKNYDNNKASLKQVTME